ncbi:MAG: radical SAM protein [Alphaproteobacteria bacterium]|nr:radical SAM protein [Alphaproteobacteria bacterium]
MAYTAITCFLKELEDLSNKDLLTIVLAGGCNLNCSWCAVNARAERSEKSVVIKASHYRDLISSLAKENLISGVAIVGDEPLLDEAWPVARGILDCANHHQLPTALITNGTKLAERSRELATRKNQILVSIDGTSAYHDKSRRVEGAYDAVICGLASAAEHPELLERITIASIVQPDKYEYLNGLPEVLARYGIKRWALSPLIQFHRNKPACLHPRLFPAIYEELPRLIELGQAAGVETMIDDGLSMLLQADRDGQLADQPVERPASSDIRVLRMRPDGLTVRYTDLLDTDTSRGLRWDGVEPPAAFYRRLYAKNPDPVAA